MHGKNWIRKALALLTLMAMLVSSIPGSVFAGETSNVFEMPREIVERTARVAADFPGTIYAADRSADGSLQTNGGVYTIKNGVRDLVNEKISLASPKLAPLKDGVEAEGVTLADHLYFAAAEKAQYAPEDVRKIEYFKITADENRAKLQAFYLENDTEKAAEAGVFLLDVTKQPEQEEPPKEETSLLLTKVWEDNHDELEMRPKKVTLELERRLKGSADEDAWEKFEGNTVELSGEDGDIWSVEWKIKEEEQEYEYRIGGEQEEKLEKENYYYVSRYSADGRTVFSELRRDLEVAKHWFLEEGYMAPKTLTMALYRDGKYYDEMTMAYWENYPGEYWYDDIIWKFEKLPVFANGKKIRWTVYELDGNRRPVKNGGTWSDPDEGIKDAECDVIIYEDEDENWTIVNSQLPIMRKKELTPGAGAEVEIGDIITYEITYNCYSEIFDTTEIIISDPLDENVEFVSAKTVNAGNVKLKPDGVYDAGKHEVTWTFKNADRRLSGIFQLELQVRVKREALKPGKVANTSYVEVENGVKFQSNTVENPVPEYTKKTEPDPGAGVTVEAGQVITYQVFYRNYKDTAADVVIRDPLDPNVEFVSAATADKPDGVYAKDSHTVTWTLKDVPAKESGYVELKVRVKPEAEKAGRVENTAYMSVDNEPEYQTNTVENPLPEKPQETETETERQTEPVTEKQTEPVTERQTEKKLPKGKGSVTVQKMVKQHDKYFALEDYAFYTALFADAALTERVTEVKALHVKESYTTSVTFNDLPYGTYYVAETDENGTPLSPDGTITEIGITKKQVKLTQAKPKAKSVITNTVDGLPMAYTFVGDAKVHKTVKAGGQAEAVSDTFYFTFFADEELTLPVAGGELTLDGESEGTVQIEGLPYGELYFAETDEHGVPVGGEFAYEVKADKSKFTLGKNHAQIEVNVTNTKKGGRRQRSRRRKLRRRTRQRMQNRQKRATIRRLCRSRQRLLLQEWRL